MALTFEEKRIYHQIHPAKLAEEWLTSIAAAYLFWQHELLLGLAVLFLAGLPVIALVILYADLEKIRDSRFGHYMKKYMTRSMDALRSIGALVLFAGTWFQSIPVAVLGLVVVLLAWFRGVIFPSPGASWRLLGHRKPSP